MNNVIQRLQTRRTDIADVPCPAVRPNETLDPLYPLLESGAPGSLRILGKAGVSAAVRGSPPQPQSNPLKHHSSADGQ